MEKAALHLAAIIVVTGAIEAPTTSRCGFSIKEVVSLNDVHVCDYKDCRYTECSCW